jgi:hypothetical protein
MRFLDILQQNSVEYATEGRYSRPGWLQFKCPFCSGGSDPNKLYAGYNTYGNYVHCWRCGHHRVGDTIVALTGRPWSEVKKLLGDLEVDRSSFDVIPKRGKLELPSGLGPLLPPHRRYLKKRGFDPDELVRLWGLQGIGLSSRLAWRVFIPIVYNGETVSWTTRSIGNGGSRYVSARADQEAINHKDLIYGGDCLRHAVIIVEGPTDVWKVGPGSAAVLGTQIRPAQLHRLCKYLCRVVCFDGDAAGQLRADKLADLLSPFPGETYKVTLKAKDPGSASEKEIAKLRRRFLE